MAEPYYHDLSAYPAAPVLWLTSLIDIGCGLLHFGDWRETIGVGETSIWAYKVPSLWSHLPPLLTYQDYLATTVQSPSMESLYRYAFTTPSTALGDLTTPTAITVLIALVLVLRAVKAVLLPFFSSIGRRAGHSTHGQKWVQENQVRIGKFGEYVFRLIYHAAISLYGWYAFGAAPWWHGSTIELFRAFPNHTIEPGMAWYYLLQSAYNIDALLTLLELSLDITLAPLSIRWSPHVRGDFNEMLVHHIVTNLLVIGSSMCRLTRIGSMVFFVHDISDVPVDCSKLANFLKYKTTTIVCFLTMTAVWAYMRLYILPLVIYRSILTQSSAVCQGLSPLLYLSYRYFFYVLVAGLIALHLAWFAMFVQIFYTMATKSEVHDYTEHKQGEETMATSTTPSKRREQEIADEKKDD